MIFSPVDFVVSLLHTRLQPSRSRARNLTSPIGRLASKSSILFNPRVQINGFASLQRQSDGTFKDADLAKVLHDATEHPAAAFRARGTPGKFHHLIMWILAYFPPASMRLHEMMGIEQNRRWGVCGLNDFRKYLGLKRRQSDDQF